MIPLTKIIHLAKAFFPLTFREIRLFISVAPLELDGDAEEIPQDINNDTQYCMLLGDLINYLRLTCFLRGKLKPRLEFRNVHCI